MKKQCKNCQQFKIMTDANLMFTLGAGAFLSGGVFMIFIITIPIGLFAWVFGLACFIIGGIILCLPKKYRKAWCGNCRAKFELES